MRFNELTSEGIDPGAKAAIKGMRELSTDEYYGLYKTMKDVAGHDGEKQTAPNGKADQEVKDKPFAYAYTDVEKNMIKGVDPKAKQITSDKSEELDEAGNNYHANRTGFAKPQRNDDERHDLDTPRPTIYALKINGKIWQKDGNTVTFFTKERALAARNSILAKRPELEVGLVQRQD
jgi:hypothetical protein